MGMNVIVPVRKTAQFQLERISTNWYLKTRMPSFFSVRMNRSMSPILPCRPTAPKRGVIPWWLHQSLNGAHQDCWVRESKARTEATMPVIKSDGWAGLGLVSKQTTGIKHL